jgi:hypothetical protein
MARQARPPHEGSILLAAVLPTPWGIDGLFACRFGCNAPDEGVVFYEGSGEALSKCRQSIMNASC